MHSFPELVSRSTTFALEKLSELEREVTDALQTSAATSLVKTAQMAQLQKVVIAVGTFSISEALLQDRLEVENGFSEVSKILMRSGESNLEKRFSTYLAAVNALKHGQGKSYHKLVRQSPHLPFRIKRPGDFFFSEGDVSEVSTLVFVDKNFVLGCVDIIRDVSDAITRARPGCFL